MFYSEAILSRRGPLAKVWLAAHMERKLSKTQTLQTDIEKSVDAIVGQDVEVMALRLSGQLLLGVVRIYSRKAKYLLDDCNEALLKIKLAFRPGIVDMTEDQLAVNRNAITLQGNDLDILLPDLNWDLDFDDRPVQPQGQHLARTADITLATMDDFQMNLDDADNFALGPSDGIGSQDFLDLGLNFGDADETMSVEVGRDAAPMRGPRESLDSHLLGRGLDDFDMLSNSVRSREASEHPFAPDVDMGFGLDAGDMEIDLGLDFGPMNSDREKTPGATTRASSPLTEPPQTPPDTTLETAQTPHADEKAKRKQKEKKVIVDNETELKDGPGARGRGRKGLGPQVNKDVSDIVTEHHYLPRSTLVMQLLEIRNDPLSYFMPTKVTAEGTFFYAGPPGLAPELAEMFMRPAIGAAQSKKRGAPPSKGSNKKRKIAGEEAEDDDEIEAARRREASAAPSMMLGSDALGHASAGPGFEFDNTNMEIDDFQGLDIPDIADIGMDRGRSRSAVPSERSRMSTPAIENAVFDDELETYADASCPIALFDERGSQSQSQKESEASQSDGKDYSRNTVKALNVIRKELQPADEDDETEKLLSFNKMSEKASRRAASSFFFELLVLGTRDCVKLSQSGPFENIEVRGKDKLWARQRHSSVAPSIVGGL